MKKDVYVYMLAINVMLAPKAIYVEIMSGVRTCFLCTDDMGPVERLGRDRRI